MSTQKSILTMTDKERIALWSQYAKSYHKYMTINVSTWHMSIFPEFHKNLEEIEQKLLHEQKNPSCYSTVRLVYDLVNAKQINKLKINGNKKNTFKTKIWQKRRLIAKIILLLLFIFFMFIFFKN